MPELSHNMALLLGMAEAALRRLDASLAHAQDTAALLATEKERLSVEAAAADAEAARAATLADALEGAVAAAAAQTDAAAGLERGRAAFADMASSYPGEYVLHGLPAAALSVALPRLRVLLAGWAPLAEPKRCAADFAAWRPLLEGERARTAVLGPAWAEDGGGDPYGVLVAELVLPPLRYVAFCVYMCVCVCMRAHLLFQAVMPCCCRMCAYCHHHYYHLLSLCLLLFPCFLLCLVSHSMPCVCVGTA